ncbi:hypothetical protein QYF36_017552 [Acer negundo]|nr:hypothetical protein QYF36_017552 [Acer negundo]
MPNSISEEPINRLPSNLGGSAHQSQLFYMKNSSSEEPIHQRPSNLQERHQRPQLSEAQITHNEFWTAEYLNYYRPLLKAAQSGDWKTAMSFIDSDPDALTAQISFSFGTVLHIAAFCCQWKFVIMLLELDVLTPQSIAVRNGNGGTVLHGAAQGGSLKTAKALVQKNANLLQMVNNQGNLPLVISICHCKNKELVWYLSLKTRVDEESLPKILVNLIQSGYHGKNYQ